MPHPFFFFLLHCLQHRLCSTHKGSLLPYLEIFYFLPLGQVPGDAMQYSQGEVDWLRSDKGPIPNPMCHFTGKRPQLHRQTAVIMFSPLEDQPATRKWGGEGRGIGPGAGLRLWLAWAGTAHRLTFFQGLGAGSQLPVEGLQVHKRGFCRLRGRRAEGLNRRQWLCFGKLVKPALCLF